MKIKKYYLIFLILLLFGISLFDARTGVQAAGSIITDISVEDVNGTTEIQIKSSAPFTYTIFRPSDPYKVVVDLQNTDLGKFREKIEIDRAGVLEIAPVMDEDMPGVAKLKISLTVPVDIEPVYSDNSLILAFDNPSAGEMAAEEMLEEEDFMAAEEEMMAEAYEEDYRETSKYVGEKISIDFQDAELIHVFRLIADMSGFNIVVSPEVKGRFSMKLTDVPWDQALDVILRNYGLSKSIEGNILRIAPTATLAKEEDAIAKAAEAQEKSGILVTRVYPVNYGDVDDIEDAIKDAKILTKRGFISVDERTSSVIIKDVEQRHEEYESLIRALDVATPQVSIDAKIVEVTTEFQKELGIQWGMLWEPPDSRMRIGAPFIPGGSGFSTGNPLLVNLPAVEVSPGKGGAIGLGYINASNTFALDLQLSAMESTGEGKVISNPKITTSDNEEAKIMQGKKIPYQTVSDQGTSTAFINATLELTVTPHITPEGTIVMEIEAKKNEADFAGPQVLGVPTIDIKEIETKVLIRNNDTLVIGGIFKNNAADTLDIVPGFADIPILGWLFQHNKDVDRTDELLIFITPRIVKQL
jgi:type IV pilus assembly protein PilQ